MNTFYLSQSEPQQSCLLTLREIILGHSAEVSETVKYGMPCFVLNKKPLCYLWIDQKSRDPYVLFVDGNKMKHSSLVQGNRARMKVFPVDPSADLPIHTLHEILDEAHSIRRSI